MHLPTLIQEVAKSAMCSALDNFKQLLDTIETIYSIHNVYALKTALYKPYFITSLKI